MVVMLMILLFLIDEQLDFCVLHSLFTSVDRVRDFSWKHAKRREKEKKKKKKRRNKSKVFLRRPSLSFSSSSSKS